MNERLQRFLAQSPESYPHQLEARFPRLVEKIVAVWCSPQATSALFDELLVDGRGGRQGFPPDIAREIFLLSVAYEKLSGAPAADDDVWAREREQAAVTLGALGLRVVPADMLRAAETRDTQHLRLFLKAGMPVDARDARNWTSLMVAAFNGNEPAAKLLLENGANPAVHDHAGYTPLHWAAFKGYLDVVAMIAGRVDCNVQSKSGLTPLLQAAAAGHASVVQMLLTRGADPNLPTSEGWTPLHKAVANGHVDVVRLLLVARASVYATHEDGSTPMSLAEKGKRLEIVQLLRGAIRL